MNLSLYLNSARVLRSYRVSGYGVKLTVNDFGEDEWHYNFLFERHRDQAGIDKALCHPTAEEMDDWKNYKKISNEDTDVKYDEQSPVHEDGNKKVMDWMESSISPIGSSGFKPA